MTDKIKAFGDLHVPGDPLILYNIWDAGSALAVAGAGAKAIATGSWGVACSLGFKDGETLPINAALENLERILSVTDLPVTGLFPTSAVVQKLQFASRQLQDRRAGVGVSPRCAVDSVDASYLADA